jgi:2-succinyl-6-hydroxy-2,4-cyclohexadiene-1-carboxylate synthase
VREHDVERQSTFACPDGGRLRYSIGSSGEPVVLIHGMGLDASMWAPQWAPLHQEFRTIRYDVRGFGGSTLPERPYSHSDDLLNLLDFLDARPAHVVGLSMGGSLALRFVLDYPKAVRSLALIDSSLDGFSWSDDWTRQIARVIGAARSGDIHAAKQLWLNHDLFAPARRDPHCAAALAAMVHGYSGWHWVNRDPVRIGTPPAIEALATVGCPTLVVVGDLDLPDFQGIALRLASGIPRATLRTIANAGHMATMEAPVIVNDSLLAHLRAASPSSR